MTIASCFAKRIAAPPLAYVQQRRKKTIYVTRPTKGDESEYIDTSPSTLTYHAIHEQQRGGVWVKRKKLDVDSMSPRKKK